MVYDLPDHPHPHARDSHELVCRAGLFFLIIPIHIYVILTRQFGTYWTAQPSFEDVQIKVFSILLLASVVSVL